ncbi:MAG: HAD family phosphatase [Fidelibacterota bacterium]|nr:MAG: HAD family phosphatase [Candidatus Neomarinimicrobiota bacterium]
MIKSVVFDMDGVVVDSEPLYQRAEESLFQEYGVTIPPEDWKLFRGCTEERFYELARNRYGITAPLEQLRVKGRQRVLEEFDAGLDYNQGFLDLHTRLADHYRLGLVTSTPGDIFQWMEQKIGLDRYFDEVITGGMTVNNKPHPEPYLEMMRRLGVTPAETAIVEDSINGLTSAIASGAWTIALTGSVPLEDMPPTNAVIHSLEEITIPFLDNLVAESHE